MIHGPLSFDDMPPNAAPVIKTAGPKDSLGVAAQSS
jgi:hypothetical protein